MSTATANLTVPGLLVNSQFQPHNNLVNKESLIRPNQPISSPLTPTQANPRTLSIRFAPLPDPRASRANVPGRFGQLDVWWSREERPDGTWGDYRLVIRRSNGQVIAIDDLEPGSDERTQALEAYRQQKPSRPSTSPLGGIGQPNFLDSESYSNYNPFSSQSITSDQSLLSPSAVPRLLPPFCTQTSNLTHSSSNSNLNSAGSSCSINPLALTPTASCDSTHSNFSATSNQKAGASSSLTKKFLVAMKKPIIKHSHRLTPTNSLPMHGDYAGAPLCKTRSADSVASNVRKRFGFGFPTNSQFLRRTRSKDESSMNTQAGFDEPPVRRRSNYPPVAQRKAHMGGSRGGAGRVVLVEEPEFVEWKSATAPASPGAVASSRTSDNSIEDDGSGMAWLRKRKKEREERARREEEERARCLGNASRSPHLETTEEPLPDADGLKETHKAELNLTKPSSSCAGDLGSKTEEHKKDDDRDSLVSSVYQSSILSRDDAQASGGTRTSTSSATLSSKDFNAEDDEDLNEEELKEEERLKALALSQSPFVKGAAEVYRDREHHQILRKSAEIS